MADMLKFRKGLYANLPSTKTAGTVYITTDEKAMYVDISATERIRISDIINVSTFNELQPPFSNEAFYYVEKDNALLKRVRKYNENGNLIEPAEYEWKQLNSTSAIENELAAVKGDVATLKSTVGSTTSGLVKDVNDLKTTVGSTTSGLVKDVATNTSDIINLKKAVGMGDNGEVEGIGATVTQLVEDLDALEEEVHGTNGNGGMKATLADHQGRIAALETKDVALKSDVAAAKSAILGQTDGVDFNGTVKGAYDAAATAKTQADKGVADAAAAKTVADTNKENLSALTGRVTALDQAGTGKVAVLESKVSALEQKDVALKSDVTAAKNEVLGTSGDAAGTATVHGALKSAAAAQSAAEAADAKAAAAQGDIDAWETAHKDDYTNTKIDKLVADAKKAGTDAASAFNTYSETHKNDYTNKQIDDKITAVTNAASAAQGAADAAQGDATLALADAAAAQKTADDYIAAHKDDYTNTKINELVADAKTAGTNAGTKAETNRQAIATLQGTVNKLDGDVNTAGSVKKQIKDASDTLQTSLESKITEKINAANAMEYKDGIGSETDLNAIDTSKAKVGDTYVITAAFGNNYKPGDLLIATGTETNGVITSNFSWTHVKTGYDASLEQVLSGVDNKIKLSSVSGGTKGEIEFATDANATGITVNNNTVTVGTGIEWGTF